MKYKLKRIINKKFIYYKRPTKEQIEIVTYYRRNPSKFLQNYYGIKLYWYQKLLLKLLDKIKLISI